MAGIYRQRHPEHTVFYRVFFYYFERVLREYEDRFEKEYGYFRPVIQDVTAGHHEAPKGRGDLNMSCLRHGIASSLCSSQRRLDCGNPMCGFARIRCPDCGEERLLMFSCTTRGFCPSCHAKRREEWGEWSGAGALKVFPHSHRP